MGRSRKKKTNKPFTPIFTHVLYSEEWKKLKNGARVLYIYLKAGYNGTNNGNITLPYSNLKGIMAPKSIADNVKALQENGWIEIVNPKRGMYREASKYKLTFNHDVALK